MTPTVALAFVEPEHYSTSFAKSKQSLLLFDLHETNLIVAEYPMRYGTDGLVGARNKVVCQFLTTDVEWLFWVDTDMGFQPDTVAKLLAVADPVERPIVGGLAFIHKELAQDGMGGFDTAPRPTIFDWVPVGEDQWGFSPRMWYEPNALLKCGATGSACILIHRQVFENIRDAQGENWYTKVPNPTTGKVMSEDISFCARAKLVGADVHVHTGVRTTHHKTLWVSEAQYWRSAIAPPATHQTAVIVPVLNRPGHAAPFMASLRASTGLATVYAVHETDDHATRDAWEAVGAELIDSGGGHTFAEKVNTAFELTGEPFVFLTGDDVRFRPGWLDHAQHTAATTGRAVIATNDLHNPLVITGEHGTHLLIARSYIEDTGASWDGPKVVCHEGYRHWYVDNEIVAAAKQRGQFAAALGSHVEHLHPIWGTAPDDDVYQEGQAVVKADAKLFAARMKLHK